MKANATGNVPVFSVCLFHIERSIFIPMSGLTNGAGRRYTVTEITVVFRVKDGSTDNIVSHLRY